MEIPFRSDLNDLNVVKTYITQALTSRWFAPARPPTEAIAWVRHLCDVMLQDDPEQFLLKTAYISHLHVKILQQKYCVIPNWREVFLSAKLFLGKLGTYTVLTDGDEICGEEVLRMLEELQNEDSAVSVVYAQCGLHVSD